jgi:hypothetical protein
MKRKEVGMEAPNETILQAAVIITVVLWGAFVVWEVAKRRHISVDHKIYWRLEDALEPFTLTWVSLGLFAASMVVPMISYPSLYIKGLGLGMSVVWLLALIVLRPLLKQLKKS